MRSRAGPLVTFALISSTSVLGADAAGMAQLAGQDKAALIWAEAHCAGRMTDRAKSFFDAIAVESPSAFRSGLEVGTAFLAKQVKAPNVRGQSFSLCAEIEKMYGSAGNILQGAWLPATEL